MIGAAMAFARRGIPVFPLQPGTKVPFRGSSGFHDATTDTEVVKRWWLGSPDANVGVATGPRSGLLVFDVDPDKEGEDSLQVLISEHGEFPATTTVKTGGGGQHYYFRYPGGRTIRNSAGRLGPGLDVRGQGGYIVVPPSFTKGPYEWDKRLPLAEPPPWLIEALEAPSGGRGQATGSPTRPIAVVGQRPSIPTGQRNHELFKLACSFWARGRDPEALGRALEETNAVRCSPPLDAVEVQKIANSVTRRYSPGSTGPNTATLTTLEGIEAELWRREWRGSGGLTDRDVLFALVTLACEHGHRIPSGVRISVGVRALASAAAVSKPTVIKATERLQNAGLVRRDGRGSGSKSGAFVLLATAAPSGAGRANPDHSTTENRRSSGQGPRAPFGATPSAERLRWSAPGLKRLGKGCGAVVDALQAAGGSATLEQLARALGKSRPRDLRRRAIARLEAAAVVRVCGDVVALTADWREALETARRDGCEEEAAAVQVARDRLDRALFAYRESGKGEVQWKRVQKAREAAEEAKRALQAARVARGSREEATG